MESQPDDLLGHAPLRGISEAGYYQSNYRALSVKGVARMRGWLRLPLAYLITRFKAPTPAGWMPQLWADLECTEPELSPQCLVATVRHRETLRRLGFSEVGFKKLNRILNPLHRDDGGINFLDASRRHYGQLIYNRSHVPPPVNAVRERVVIAFTAVFKDEIFSYANNSNTPFDAVPRQKVVRISSNDAAQIYQRFVDDLKRRNEEPLHFSDLESLRNWFDSNAIEVFNHRVRKRLFIRMSDKEVAIARQKLPPPVAKA